MPPSQIPTPKYQIHAHSAPVFPTETYAHPQNSLEFLVELIITDNEKESLQSALHRKGFEGVELKRYVHYEVAHHNVKSLDAFIDEIKTSGELFNSNKEKATVLTDETPRPAFSIHHSSFSILVRDRDDFAGQGKAQNLRRHLHEEKHIKHVKRGTLWVVTLPIGEQDPSLRSGLLSTNIFYNPHAQTVVWY